MHYFLEQPFFSIGKYTLTPAMLAAALMVWVVTTVLLRAVRRIINRKNQNPQGKLEIGRRTSIYLLAKYVIWTVSFVLILEVMGFQISVLLAGSAALLVGFGLGVQPIFRDIVSGVFLLFEGAIEVGDVLELDGKLGKVREINLRTSEILTNDGLTMIVPNHKFITENVLNWTHISAQPSAFRIQVKTPYNVEEDLILALLHRVAEAAPEVLSEEDAYQPQVLLIDLQDQFALYELRFWTLNKFEAEKLQSDLRGAIRRELRAAKIPMLNE